MLPQLARLEYVSRMDDLAKIRAVLRRRKRYREVADMAGLTESCVTRIAYGIRSDPHYTTVQAIAAVLRAEGLLDIEEDSDGTNDN